jgi:putative nucleotidyltransferase with HDIG domain
MGPFSSNSVRPGGEAPAAPGTGDSRPTLTDTVSTIDGISSLPLVALRVMEVAGDPEASAAHLKAVVEADPSLCSRVLRCVNSASYGLRRGVEDLGQAVAYLGFQQIRDLAITATVSGLFRSGKPIHTYQRTELWRHMLSVGICSRMIAARSRLPGFENAFLAGLLHDIGIILFDQNRHEDFRHVITQLNTSRTLCEVERKSVGWDHTELGADVGAKWKLPETVLSAIRHHHEPTRYRGPDEALVHCVSIANLICSVKDITSVGVNLVRLVPESLDALELSRPDLKILAEDLDAEIEANQHLFDFHRESG